MFLKLTLCGYGLQSPLKAVFHNATLCRILYLPKCQVFIFLHIKTRWVKVRERNNHLVEDPGLSWRSCQYPVGYKLEPFSFDVRLSKARGRRLRAKLSEPLG